jgi:beta-lactamase regulating signal transducer with metallopeptidase domain
MSEVLKIVLSLSLSGTILMTGLFALKPLYKNRMSKTWQYYIWLVIIARMLLPFTPETTLIGYVIQMAGSNYNLLTLV